MNTTKGPIKVTYKKGVTVGAAAAENDDLFLAECFVDNGTVDILSNVQRNECIIVGRVGAGKSALIKHLEGAEKCKRIDPQEFAMTYIENSSAIQLMSELGVSLDVLFQALWKHVLTVEVLRLKYDPFDKKIKDSIDLFFSPKEKKDSSREALEYFRDFGGSDFWQTTEMRIREIVERTESSIKAELGADAGAILAKLKAKEGVSSEDRRQFKDKCQRAVSNVQMQKLHKVIDVLHEVIEDRQRKFFLVIDDLDSNWSGREVRYRLIRALIEAIKKFRKIRNLKIVISMRVDLLDTVFRETRDSGFQEEKFEDFFLRLRWSEADIVEVMDRRIQKTFRDQYTRNKIGFYDIFPEKIGRENCHTYISDRIAGRPRDAIIFLNAILDEAAGKTQISKRIIQEAERSYSLSRTRSLCDEWNDRYPNLSVHLEFLRDMPSRFLISEIPVQKIISFLISLVDGPTTDEVVVAAQDIVSNGKTFESTSQAIDFLNVLMPSLFIVGAIGAKHEPTGRPEWAATSTSGIMSRRFDQNTQVYVHPMLFRQLGIKPVGTTI